MNQSAANLSSKPLLGRKKQQEAASAHEPPQWLYRAIRTYACLAS